MRRILLVASRTFGGAELRRRLALKRSTDPDLQVYLLIAGTSGGSAEAARQLASEIAELQELNYDVDGSVGVADPLSAVRAVLDDRSFDEIILLTLPVGKSSWLRMDLPHRIERASRLPVEHIVGDEADDTEDVGPVVTFPGTPALGHVGPVQVLLVEDNSADAELTQLALRRCTTPNEVTTVANGAEALERLKAVGGPAGVQLMLVDLKMPVIDGFELLEALRDDYDLDTLAVVVVTTSDRAEDRRRAHELGAHAYITKEPLFPVYREVVDGLLAEVASSR